MTIIVTHHAAERYVERVDGSLTLEQAVTAIQASDRAIRCAIGFGCSTVLTGKARLIIKEGKVVTVLSRWERRGWLPQDVERRL